MTASRRPPVTVGPQPLRLRTWQCECMIAGGWPGPPTNIQKRTHYWSELKCSSCAKERPMLHRLRRSAI